MFDILNDCSKRESVISSSSVIIISSYYHWFATAIFNKLSINWRRSVLAPSPAFSPSTFKQCWIHKCARLVRLNQMFADDSVLCTAGRRLWVLPCLCRQGGPFLGHVVLLLWWPYLSSQSPCVNAACRLAKQIKHRVKHFVFGFKFSGCWGQKAVECSLFLAPNKHETLKMLRRLLCYLELSPWKKKKRTFLN